MRIFLVRHGRPAGVDAASISGRAIGEWVRRYDTFGIEPGLPPSRQVSSLASEACCFIASDVRRANESAARLVNGRPVLIEPDLREAPLPTSLPTSLKLPPGVWIVLARLAWFLNFGDARETVAETRMRAARMADRLIALAAEQECVMVVGHGMFNRFVARELRSREWRGPRSLRSGYWSIAEFHHPQLPTRPSFAT